MSTLGNSCHRKKFLVKETNFFLEAKIFCHRNNFFDMRRNSCHRKKLLVTGTNFMPQLKITAILDIFCCIWLPLFRAKSLAESIGSEEEPHDMKHPLSMDIFLKIKNLKTLIIFAYLINFSTHVEYLETTNQRVKSNQRIWIFWLFDRF